MTDNQIIVKITNRNFSELRYTPNKSGIWNGIKFIVDDPTCKECDFWFVIDSYRLDDFSDNEAVCPKENIFFVSTEPDEIHVWKDKFVQQFCNVVSIQKHKYDVPNSYSIMMNEWFVGLKFHNGSSVFDGLNEYSLDYDTLSAMQPLKKEKLISVISSNKQSCEGHKNRLQFANFLKEEFKDKVDFWGRGIKDFSDKWDVLAPYKYHIALENSCLDDYFTEKILDPFLAFCYPIYYGAPNIYRYFSENSLTTIDIEKPYEAVDIIKSVVENNLYDKNLVAICNARDLVLNKYNKFALMAELILQQKKPFSKPTLNKINPEWHYIFTSRVKHYFGEDSFIIKCVRPFWDIARPFVRS
ncbi:MAG: glycosyltransferase family 10 [Acidaminococcaceae bacterium]|nr:glycosyltransferase family 10 [Acidaminococcaceae bacterium]